MVGAYQLIATLRTFGKWMGTEFRMWLGEFLDGAIETTVNTTRAMKACE